MGDGTVIGFPGRSGRGGISRVAVIGAGLSGLACAERLAGRGLDVTVFDKGRAPGGRMATRRTDAEDATLRFDHGAQYFTARDPRFRSRVEDWVARGAAAPWAGRIVRIGAGGIEESPGERFVGTPGMTAPARLLAESVAPRSGVRVAEVVPGSDGWRLRDEAGRDLGSYDRVAVAVPSPQAVPLLAEAPDLASAAAEAVMAGCWSVLARFPQPLGLDYDGAFVTDSPLSWIACDSSKPGRDAGRGETWVLHGSPAWSQRHIEDDPAGVIDRLTAAFRDLAGVGPVEAGYLAAHRWRFSIPIQGLDQDCLYDPERGLGACGDWCLGGRVEGAFLSGLALADRILADRVLAEGSPV
ncbi:FAD-dependent oxidoreductase [Skermanella mucosa]|uniref:NAD(P)/FAD-dependent oxidoreductase n=1 Tax=Skermanella mucosa TaxID=1789672 RepID=UPI001E35D828|nr:FAD-dependent oxidoreductase [Skermanella mucosa]UEM21756.1 FAD-dependent oxidoreductase [Skermanella mucosa]